MSLLEVVLAMLILSIGLLGLAAALPVAMTAVAEGGARGVAVAVATGDLALARGAAYERLPDLVTDGFVPASGVPGFERALTVEVGQPAPSTSTVTVRARRIGAQLPGDAVTLATVIGP